MSVSHANSQINRLQNQIHAIREFFEPGPHRNNEIAGLNAKIAQLRALINALLNTRSGG